MLSYMIVSFTDYNRNYQSQYKFGKLYISVFILLFIVNSCFVTFRAILLFIQNRKKRASRRQEATPKGPDLFDHIGDMSNDFDQEKKKGSRRMEDSQRGVSMISKSERLTSQDDQSEDLSGSIESSSSDESSDESSSHSELEVSA